jgi:alanine transaminase
MAGLTPDSLNPAFLKVEYAVRGELAIKAEEYRVRLADGASDLPFSKVVSSNIGNPQQKGLDQPPLTFPRQVRLRLMPRRWRMTHAL